MLNKEKEILDIVNISSKYQFKDINDIDRNKFTFLMYVLMRNEKLKLSPTQIDYLIREADLKHINIFKANSLMLALENNINLNLERKTINYLIKNTDLSQINTDKFNGLMVALFYNKKQKVFLTDNQWKYLIKNSDLKQINAFGWNSLMIACYNESADDDILKIILKNYQKENINLIASKTDQAAIKKIEQKLQVLEAGQTQERIDKIINKTSKRKSNLKI